MVFLDDLAAKQRNRQLLADTAELGALLERIKTAYQEQSQAKLVTFSPSTISMSPKEMSQSIDNLNTPLPPEMSTVLKSDTVTPTPTTAMTPPTPPQPTVVKEEATMILSPRQELMAKAETLFSQSSSSSSEEEQTESIKPPSQSVKSESKRLNSVKSEPKSISFNDALSNVPLHAEPSQHNFAEPDLALFSSKRTSTAASKRSSQRTTIESATSAASASRRSREATTTPVSSHNEMSRKSGQNASVMIDDQQDQKSSGSRKSFQLLESPRRMSQATTSERIMSDDSVSETVSVSRKKEIKSSRQKTQFNENEIDEKLWYQNDVSKKSPSKFASSWNALDNDDDSFSFD